MIEYGSENRMQKITQIHKFKFGLLRDDETTDGAHLPLLIFNIQTL